MTSNEIRASFLRYFEKNGHRVVPSSPLVPGDDPTLLFTNAGMNQFKDLFLGREKREYARATTSQKVMRVSGKHNDLDNVGPACRASEIYFVRGTGTDPEIEIWNNVFMEFERGVDGTLTPLPAPSIDTGMGLERVTSVLQSKQSNYDTDVFMPLLTEMGRMSGHTYAQSMSDADIS